MDHIDISMENCYTAEEYAKALIDDYGEENVLAVRLNTVNGIPDETVSSMYWPLILECRDAVGKAIEIRIRNFESGTSSAESDCLINVLEYAGFDFDEESVYGKKFDDERWTKK